MCECGNDKKLTLLQARLSSEVQEGHRLRQIIDILARRLEEQGRDSELLEIIKSVRY